MNQLERILDKLETVGKNGLPVEHKLESTTLQTLVGGMVGGLVLAAGIIGLAIYFGLKNK